MSAQGEDVLAFLDRAITEHEGAARAAAEVVGGAGWDGWDREVAVELPGGDTIADGVMYGDLYEPMKKEACLHIALQDPESVLRRCAADRKLIKLHRPVVLRGGGGAKYFDTTTVCTSCEPPRQFPEEAYPCPTIVTLAEGYGWTEGER